MVRSTKGQLVLEIISRQTNEKKLLDEWAKIINKKIPSHKRMSKKSLSTIIYILCQRGEICAEKQIKDRGIFYEFKSN